MTELEQDKQEIRKLCLEVMNCKKAKHAVRLQAATLLAGVQGLYGPGRPRVLARETDSDGEAKELNNRGKTDGGAGAVSLSSLLEWDYSETETCNDHATSSVSR